WNSARSNSSPRAATTCSGPAGTASSVVLASVWKNGRSSASHLAGTPGANQAPPVASVTDHRAPCGPLSRSVAAAAGTTASTVHRGAPQVMTIGPAVSTVRSPAPPAGTGTSTPSTATTR